MKKVILQRHWQDNNQATGTLMVLNRHGQPIFACLCIERGDRNNAKSVSNVPAGEYPLILEPSPRFGQDLWELKNVPGRSECKIHPANHWHQLNGCIAPGVSLTDSDRDGYYDVTSSRNTLREFHNALKGESKTSIIIHNPC